MTTALLPNSPPGEATQQAYFTPKEGATHLRCGERFLRDGVNHNGFPHSRIGGALVFSASDLAEIYQRYRVQAAPRRGRRRAA
jgi:hypothetical protein